LRRIGRNTPECAANPGSLEGDPDLIEFDSTQCYKTSMIAPEDATRVFKTRWFFKAAKKALIKDGELCGAMAEVMKGQTDDLGGGVFKKSLNRNKHRSIVLARGRRYWFYVYLFAKNDRE